MVFMALIDVTGQLAEAVDKNVAGGVFGRRGCGAPGGSFGEGVVKGEKLVGEGGGSDRGLGKRRFAVDVILNRGGELVQGAFGRFSEGVGDVEDRHKV